MELCCAEEERGGGRGEGNGGKKNIGGAKINKALKKNLDKISKILC